MNLEWNETEENKVEFITLLKVSNDLLNIGYVLYIYIFLCKNSPFGKDLLIIGVVYDQWPFFDISKLGYS